MDAPMSAKFTSKNTEILSKCMFPFSAIVEGPAYVIGKLILQKKKTVQRIKGQFEKKNASDHIIKLIGLNVPFSKLISEKPRLFCEETILIISNRHTNFDFSTRVQLFKKCHYIL